ncbi:MAG: T9SS type A sorting domain-containing protein, partial [candidate division KSB1 bacterium]|nr:T9SS type A sorting domain-containing protein [candidate division KSB1 bacterium]
EPVTTTKSSALFSSHEQNGMIKMAMASAQAIADNSCKIRFIFEPIADRKVLAVTPITIQQFSVNGNDYEIKNLPQSQLDNFSVPQNYGLDQNYPNPFNAETMVKYQLPQADFVTIEIYNLLGQKLRTLVSEHQGPGIYRIRWDGRNDWGEPVGSGEYLCQMKTANFVTVRKMLLLR